MPKERTLAIIKPHLADSYNALLDAIEAYTEKGLHLVEMKRLRMSGEQAEDFYLDLKGKPFFEELIMASTMGPCIVIVLEGEDAIRKVREIHGPTDPRKGNPAIHLRSRYGEPWGGPRNGFHGSDSLESFKRECEILNIIPIFPIL